MSESLVGHNAKRTVQRMGEAAADFLSLLTADQRRKCVLDFPSQEQRTDWHYTPQARVGLSLAEMERTQQQRAHRLVTTGLSRAGYATASTIIGIENTLDAKEGWNFRPVPRDPLLYYITIFGEPDAKKPWGWRFEGHHISLNYTIVNGQIVSPTPTFFGSNPAETPLSSVATLRPLGSAEDLGRELVHALNQEQRQRAILSALAPTDIITANRATVVDGAFERLLVPAAESAIIAQQLERLQLDGDPHEYVHAMMDAVRYSTAPKGISASAMGNDQREILISLVRDYIDRMPDELAEIEMVKLHEQGIDKLHFVWAGGIERHQHHYYRIQGSRFLVEYDNTQNDVNHIHSVWRDPENDFGADLLAHHYQHDH